MHPSESTRAGQGCGFDGGRPCKPRVPRGNADAARLSFADCSACGGCNGCKCNKTKKTEQSQLHRCAPGDSERWIDPITEQSAQCRRLAASAPASAHTHSLHHSGQRRLRTTTEVIAAVRCRETPFTPAFLPIRLPGYHHILPIPIPSDRPAGLPLSSVRLNPRQQCRLRYSAASAAWPRVRGVMV
jgi:hypothetical protein